ncbi:glycosyl hydrolase [Mariniflexile litorale]|uniref:Glycosyl hydrolase n=1 Tax=Mariniflexile litorale TaxID=3045158 RepID=A0AAU7EBM1_9FLAO|nr:glycosyl hydrolase [Mariniflexile sp. KMM 9835]MDQ8210559.1 glycosyl hydrolase [Mariniflexile sp. KMM 9835]
MKRTIQYLCVFFIVINVFSCKKSQENQTSYFEPTQESAQSWVYWYWMKSAYSKEGITADLEAMKKAGIRGAYLMTIKGPDEEPLIDSPILQLSKEFWDMVHWALTEADRLGLKIAFHAADGFAVAGGPWITPEMSMQKVVWADTILDGNDIKKLKLPLPKHYKDYYVDIATFAISVSNSYKTSLEIQPEITTSINNSDVSFLSDNLKEQTQFKLSEPGWIQYEFKESFTCKSIQIETKGNNYQAHRLIVEVSNDGENFKSLGRLETPRSGWQDTDAFYTHSLASTTAKFFRFVYNPEGSEPGAEDLDMAKWNQGLKVTKIILSGEPLIDNYQGKSGAVWRISPKTSESKITKEDCVDTQKMVNISQFVDKKGVLNWNAPKGNWKIIRFGHTSTGHENATGGAGKGLEVDKFNPEAIRFQLDHWFGEMLRTAGPELASRVVEILHLDSWECGSQNWSPVFQAEFKKRRGYDIVKYLPVMAGIPLDDIETSENILYDIRKTISELITDNFFATLADEAKKSGVKFSSENVAPTMPSDGLLHFKYIDYPSGEFWLKSPTHDKPNDMLDAISGGHIYGKDIIQAEAFTQLRMDWDEHPGNLKTLADRDYALGINRFFYHVFVHNPWVDKKPGMTLDGIGTFFQRDQTWWGPGKAFFDYCQRVQFHLQKGNPVIDFAVFTGEEIPSRSLLPGRLVPFIPNVFGKERVASEKVRLENTGQPSARMPKEVRYSKNSTDLSKWVNALNGYKYDSFNSDVLLNAYVKDGNVIFSEKVAYKFLIFPGQTKMSPNNMMSLAVAEKMLALVKDGATIFVNKKPNSIPGKHSDKDKQVWQKVIDELWGGQGESQWKLGKGKVIKLPYLGNDFSEFGIQPDVILAKKDANTIAWAHRETANEHVYFLSNQGEEKRQVEVAFRVSGKIPELFHPITNKTMGLKNWKIEKGRTIIPLQFEANESYIIIFKEATNKKDSYGNQNWSEFKTVQTLNEDWRLQFDKEFHGPAKLLEINKLFDWSTSTNDSIKYYSGTAKYSKTFNWKEASTYNLHLQFQEINNIASIEINGKNCGTLWTYPYRVNISEAIKKGQNTLIVKLTNTWANRLIGDQKLLEKDRLTWTTAPFRLEGNPLLKSGLLGDIKIVKEQKQ